MLRCLSFILKSILCCGPSSSDGSGEGLVVVS